MNPTNPNLNRDDLNQTCDICDDCQEYNEIANGVFHDTLADVRGLLKDYRAELLGTNSQEQWNRQVEEILGILASPEEIADEEWYDEIVVHDEDLVTMDNDDSIYEHDTESLFGALFSDTADAVQFEDPVANITLADPIGFVRIRHLKAGEDWKCLLQTPRK